MAKKTIDQFLRLEHEIWEYKMPPLAKLMLIAIYRWTAGFHRNKCKISDATITEMTGIKTPYPHRKFLIENDYIKYHHTDGTTGIYEIPPNIINRSKKQPPNRIDSTPKFNEGDPSTELNGYREAKENIKENLKKESGTLSDDLINEMKSKYPEKDIDQAQKSFLTYPHHQNKKWSAVVWAEKFERWCAAEKPSHKKYISQFKLDSCGFPMGWCQKCNVSASYEENQLYGDSRCCNAKILPSKITPNA